MSVGRRRWAVQGYRRQSVKDKVAIVTGASRGIGRTMAIGLAEDGFSVALIARSGDALAEVAGAIERAGGAARVIPLDVSRHEGIQRAVSSVQDEFERTLSVNLTAAFCFLQAVVPIMKEQGHGTVINVASLAGKVGFAGYGAYGASKFGLVGLGESLFRELSPAGIKVMTLCPSWVDTDMARLSGLPPQEMIQTEDLLKTVRWFLSLSPAACVRELMIECRSEIY